MRIGVYEKGLPPLADWPARFAAARAAGFDFLEIAVDETAEKQVRLDWSPAERSAFANAAQGEGLAVYALIFSVLRKWSLGAPDAAIRQRGLALLERGIALAAETGMRCVQIPGYYSFYEPAGPDGAYIPLRPAYAIHGVQYRPYGRAPRYCTAPFHVQSGRRGCHQVLYREVGYPDPFGYLLARLLVLCLECYQG